MRLVRLLSGVGPVIPAANGVAERATCPDDRPGRGNSLALAGIDTLFAQRDSSESQQAGRVGRSRR